MFHTKGNRNCNIILRGSATATNYGSEYIAFTEELMRKSGMEPSIIIDCSHGNSLRNPLNQPTAFRDVIGQVKNGATAIAGVMLESYLKTGKQPMKSRAELTYGLSITDGCLGWDETEALILEQYAAL